MKFFLLKLKLSGAVVVGLGTVGVLQIATPVYALDATQKIEDICVVFRAHLPQNLAPAFETYHAKYVKTIEDFVSKDNHTSFAHFKSVINTVVHEYINNVLNKIINDANIPAHVKQCARTFKNELETFNAMIQSHNGTSAVLFGTQLLKFSHLMPNQLITRNGGATGLLSKLGHRLRCKGNGCKG